MTSNYIHLNRLQKLNSLLKEGETLIIFAASHQIRNRDVEYKFRQDSDYFYLTGISEADGILVLQKDKRFHFCLPKNKSEEIWTGIRLGKEKIGSLLGLTESFELKEWSEKIEEILTNTSTLFHFFGKDSNRDRELIEVSARLNRKLRDGKFGPNRIEIPEFLHEMRLVKSEEEIQFLREAAVITDLGHREAIRASRPGIKEFELESILESVYLRNGSWGGGYGHIVASGKNATILHYTNNDDVLHEGDLILIDSGAEKNYYTADITRTFPVGKQFSPLQKDIYELVLSAQESVISICKKGVSFLDLHNKAVEILTRGLMDLKLLESNLEKNIEEGLYKKFYMHRTGHYLGMDVHDVGKYYINGKSRLLEPGQVLTVEPGLYFDPEDTDIPDKFRGIGIRIEDDVLITESEPEVLTFRTPKTISDLENLKKD